MKTILRHFWQDLQCRPVLQQYLLMGLEDHLHHMENAHESGG